ncbi:MAG: pinensin family lanthipeptide [Rhodothermaceae bacterium]
MKKIKLNINQLKVNSFETLRKEKNNGTVLAYKNTFHLDPHCSGTCDPDCIFPTDLTCDTEEPGCRPF